MKKISGEVLLLAALIALHLIPLWTLPYFPSQDGPAHLSLANTLRELLFEFGPCLIIIDEFVAYARNLYGVDRLPAGTFEAIMTFMQSLTEAVKRSEESMLLISLPESDIEVGGEAGRGGGDEVGDPAVPEERLRLGVAEL